MKPIKPPKIPSFPGRSMGHLPGQPFAHTLSPEEFQKTIEQSGIRMILSRPMPCPYGRKDLRGEDHSPACEHCQNGFIFYAEQEFVGLFQGNSTQRQFMAQGTWDFDSAMVTIPSHDTNGRELNAFMFDRIVIPGDEVRYWQWVEHSQTGVDRLKFPALRVEAIMSASGEQFVPNVDFVINPNGRIEWRKKRPRYDAMNQLGEIYSIVYYCRPVYSVQGIPSRVRMVQTQGQGGPGTPNQQTRLPSLVRVVMEFIPTTTGRNNAPYPPQQPGPSGV